ncbi:addiction module toxin RelE [Spirochaetia bacterium]|nr:addiction module toxin RelE [Spirochaetia bacterium]
MIVRIFKYKWFAKFAEKAAITDDDLREAVKEIEAGLVEANYGGDVYKKRIARPGEGKRGGYRTIVFFRRGDKLFFVYGFPKSKQDNIKEDEERDFKKAAKRDFAWSDEDLEAYKKTGQLIEI